MSTQKPKVLVKFESFLALPTPTPTKTMSFASRSLLRTARCTIKPSFSSTSRSILPSIRQISSKQPLQNDVKNPSHASTNPEHIIPYPEDDSKGRDIKNDVGHDTTGGKVGRHTKRTLSTFSMVSLWHWRSEECHSSSSR